MLKIAPCKFSPKLVEDFSTNKMRSKTMDMPSNFQILTIQWPRRMLNILLKVLLDKYLYIIL